MGGSHHARAGAHTGGKAGRPPSDGASCVLFVYHAKRTRCVDVARVLFGFTSFHCILRLESPMPDVVLSQIGICNKSDKSVTVNFLSYNDPSALADLHPQRISVAVGETLVLSPDTPPLNHGFVVVTATEVDTIPPITLSNSLASAHHLALKYWAVSAVRATLTGRNGDYRMTLFVEDADTR